MKKLLSLFITALLALGILYFPIGSVSADVVALGDLTVHFIDVGQGDSCLVELPDDRLMLIDAGVASEGKTVESYINDNIKGEDGKPITFLDFVVFTHSDADHIGGMSYVLGKFDAGTVYRSNEECERCSDPALKGKEQRNCFWGEKHGTKDTKAYHEAIDKAYEVADEVIVTNPEDDTQNEITSTNEKYYTICFYSPLSSFYKDLNNYSPIIVIEYRGKRIVLSGDAEKENEAEFVVRAKDGEGRYSVFKNFCADVIKLGHHGSSTSSSEDYLDIMASGGERKDVFIVISCGKDNKYGHPHKEVLSRLADMGFDENKILRTDLSGDIVLTVAERDGIFETVCVKGSYSGENSSGSGGNASGSVENPSGSDTKKNESFAGLISKFNTFSAPVKIGIIIAVVLVVFIIIYLIAFSKKKKRRRR